MKSKPYQPIKHTCFALQLLAMMIISLPHFAHAKTMMDLFNKRYCEVILGGEPLVLSVYNTIGLSDCPNEQWQKMDESALRKQTGSFFVKLNGPRYWVINGMTHSTLVSTKEQIFGGIPMREAAVVHITMLDAIHRDNPYHEHRIKRHTTWIYQKGTQVYELIDPKGHVYVMQSYSIQKKSQTLDSLATLGNILTLPKGWQFKTGVLQTTQTVPAIDNKAVVIQDDFLNTYQLSLCDLLA